jgi:hypothetical protein
MESSMESVTDPDENHREIGRGSALPWRSPMLALSSLAILAACGGATDAVGRAPLSGAGGADSSAGSDSGANNQSKGGRDGAIAAGGASAGIGGGSPGTHPDASAGATNSSDGRACLPLDQVCAADSDCCSGYCSTNQLGPDGGPAYGFETLACYKQGCTHEYQPCQTTWECCGARLGGAVECRSGLCSGGGGH